MPGDPPTVAHARNMQRPSAHSTLLYALGDLVYPSQDAVPTSAFIVALCQAGYERHAARQGIARAGNAGWINNVRRGRETWWAITERGHRLIGDGLRRIADLGRDAAEWDGRWAVVVTTVPHARRAVRQSLNRYLTWSGFGSPMPGVWMSPFVEREHSARFAIDNLDLSETTISFIGTAGSVGLTVSAIVGRAWSLDDLDSHYEKLVKLYRQRDPQTGDEALQCVLQLDGDLQRLPLLDPQLPTVLAPDSASREAARELLAFRATWLVPAREYWHSLAAGGRSRLQAASADRAE